MVISQNGRAPGLRNFPTEEVVVLGGNNAIEGSEVDGVRSIIQA